MINPISSASAYASDWAATSVENTLLTVARVHGYNEVKDMVSDARAADKPSEYQVRVIRLADRLERLGKELP